MLQYMYRQRQTKRYTGADKDGQNGTHLNTKAVKMLRR